MTLLSRTHPDPLGSLSCLRAAVSQLRCHLFRRGCPRREGWSGGGFLLPRVVLNPRLTQEAKCGKPSPSPPAETTRRPDLSRASGRSHAPRCVPLTPQLRWVPSPFPCLLPTHPTHSLSSFSCEHKSPHLRICSRETQPKTGPM